MAAQISLRQFKRAYPGLSESEFALFQERLTRELSRRFPSNVQLRSIELGPSFRDAGGNLHASITGALDTFADRASLSGQFVWLKRLGRFRGSVYSHDLVVRSDMELVMMAREAFRRREYREASTFLQAIQDLDSLPASARRLLELTASRI